MGEARVARAGLARPRCKLRPSADCELIECVRMRPVLYDPSHSGYKDYVLKMRIWQKIARQINATPKACKERWNNIRDNYRKSLGRNRPNALYKFSSLLGFMDRFYKVKAKAGDNKDNALHNDDKLDDDVSNDAIAGDEKDEDLTSDTSEIVRISDIKGEHSDVEDQSESMVDYEYFEKSSSSAPAQLTSQAQAVDAFLGALAPPLKTMSPYHLVLAKAEIFAIVHKYELKGIVEAGWDARNPLP